MNLKKKIKIIGKEIKTRDLILIGIGFANLIFLLGVGVFLLVKKDSSTNQEVDNVSSKQELEEKTKFCQSERLGIKMIVPESWECKEKEVEEVEVDWSDEKGWNGEYLVTSDFFDIKFNFTGSAGYPVEEDYEVTTFFENETFKIRKYVEKDPSGKYPLVLVMGGIKDNFLTIGAVDIRWDYHYMSVETQLPKNQKDQILSVLNSVEVNRDLALKEELENNHKKKGPKEEDYYKLGSMVKEGFKECKSESLGFVIQIPKNWVCGEDEIGEEENEHFTFINKTIESGTYELRFISGGGGASIYTDDDEVESIYKSDLVYLMYVPETNWDCIGEGQIYTNGKYNPVFHVCNVAKLTDTDKEILKEVMGSIKIIK